MTVAIIILAVLLALLCGAGLYVAGTVELPSDVSFRLEHQPKRVTIWSNMTGRRHRLKPAADGTFTLRLRPMESVFITFVTESKVCETPA